MGMHWNLIYLKVATTASSTTVKLIIEVINIGFSGNKTIWMWELYYEYMFVYIPHRFKIAKNIHNCWNWKLTCIPVRLDISVISGWCCCTAFKMPNGVVFLW